MSSLRRRRSLRPLLIALGLAFMGLVVAPGASAAVPLDTVAVTGNTGDGAFASIDIIAPCSSSTCATGPGPGFVNYEVAPYSFPVSGSVTCVGVTGPDQGVGTSTAPTTAVRRFSTSIGIDEVTVVDNGGDGADTFQAGPDSSRGHIDTDVVRERLDVSAEQALATPEVEDRRGRATKVLRIRRQDAVTAQLSDAGQVIPNASFPLIAGRLHRISRPRHRTRYPPSCSGGVHPGEK